jgi:hypothetical protein
VKIIKWIDWETAKQYKDSELDFAAETDERIEFLAEIAKDEPADSTPKLLDLFIEDRAKMNVSPAEVMAYRKLKEKARHLTVKYMKENELKFSGTYHQGGDNGVPLFNNGFVLCLSQRDWGALMAEVCDINEALAYCAWAWRAPIDEIEKYPDMIESIGE